MLIDWSINLIGILNAVVFVGGGMYFLSDIRSDVTSVKLGLEKIDKQVVKLTEKVGIVPVVDTKLEGLKQRFEDEKHVVLEFRDWVTRELSRMWTTINTISAAGRTVMPL